MKKIIALTIAGIIASSALGVGIGFGVPTAKNAAIRAIRSAVTTSAQDPKNDTDNENKDDAQVVQLMDQASQDTVNIIKSVKPSVVCITTKANGYNWFAGSYTTENSGSGVIFNEDDENIYIVTSNAIVSGVTEVMVSVSDSDLVNAQLVGRDQSNNIAVIAVDKIALRNVGITGVKCAVFGDSDTLQIGETVIAIGNALGDGISATKGIISSTSKQISTNFGKLSVLQTDAAINTGNEGGALVNSSGMIIGINTAKVSATTVEGIGFAISSNNTKSAIEGIMGATNSPALGVYVQNITKEDSEQYGIPQAGVYVADVNAGGSADSAGIKAGDIITAYNNTPIFNGEDLQKALKASNVGDTVTITVYRNGKTQNISVKLKKVTGF